MLFSILKSSIGIFVILTLVFVGVWNGTLTKIQKSKVLGSSSQNCSSKLDVNCDSQTNTQDVKAIVDFVVSGKSGSTEPSPTPTTCGNGRCEKSESSTSCPADCITTAPPKPSTPPPSTTPPPPPTPISGQPYPGAPLCPSSAHSNITFHTLWNPELNCHYDHEHGETPFTSVVAGKFPGFDLKSLLGNVELGHTTLSSDMENTMKHGGFKWQVDDTPQGCLAGFEGATYCVSSYAVQYHNFGNYSVELEARFHTTAALLKVCDPSNQSDCGYMYAVQFADYGQRVSGYQGDLLPYPNNPAPAYPTSFGPYLTVDCLGVKAAGLNGTCFPNLDNIRSLNRNNNSIWTTKRTGSSTSQGSTLFKLLFRVRDVYQVVKWNDNGSIPSYPFTFIFICGENTFNPAGCRWNNTTSTIHEVAGIVPPNWDGASYDRDSRAGRVTADGYVTRYGQWKSSCTSASTANDCFPIKMVSMFTGFYGSELSAAKVSNPTPQNTPERDIYFCNGVLCSETSSGAVPSGWVGASN